MRFLYSKAVSIPAGASTAPASHRQAQSRERLDERVSGRVDRCGVPERRAGLPLHLLVPPFRRRFVSLGQIALMATQH